MHEIKDGIYRLSGFVNEFGITFNQFLVNDEQPTLIHTGCHKAYKKMIERGFRTDLQGVAMQRPNEPGYNLEENYPD